MNKNCAFEHHLFKMIAFAMLIVFFALSGCGMSAEPVIETATPAVVPETVTALPTLADTATATLVPRTLPTNIEDATIALFTYSSNGKYLVVGTYSGIVHVVDTDTLNDVTSFSTGLAGFADQSRRCGNRGSLVISDDGLLVAVYEPESEKTLAVFDASDGSIVFSYLGITSPGGNCDVVRFNQDSSVLEVFRDGVLNGLFRVSDGAPLDFTQPRVLSGWGVAYSLGLNSLLGSLKMNSPELIRTVDWQDWIATDIGLGTNQYPISVSPDERWVLMMTRASEYRLFKLSQGRAVPVDGVFSGYPAQIDRADDIMATSVQLAGDSHYALMTTKFGFAAMGWPYSVQRIEVDRFDLETRQNVASFVLSSALRGQNVISPDGRSIAVIRSPGTIDISNLEDGTLQGTYTLGEICRTDWFLEAGSTRASFSFASNVIQICSQLDNHVIMNIVVPTGMITSLAYSPDGRFIASSGGMGVGSGVGSTNSQYDPNVYLWRVSDGSLVKVFHHHAGNVTAVAFSPPNGEFLAAAGGQLPGWCWMRPTDPSIVVWRVFDGSLVSVLPGPSVGTWSLGYDHTTNTFVPYPTNQYEGCP